MEEAGVQSHTAIREGPLRILLIYPSPPGHSGQRAAAELIGEILSEQHEVETLVIPGFPRTSARWLPRLIYPFQLALTALWTIRKGMKARDLLVFCHCQSRITLVRDALIRRCFQLFHRRVPRIASLNGNLFSNFQAGDSMARLFHGTLSQFDMVTVVGPVQKEKMEGLGFEPSTVRILPNTCEIQAISKTEIEEKQSLQASPLRALHLSSLIESKGYIDVMEALPLLKEKVETIICGGLAATPFDQRFTTLEEAETWLMQQTEKADSHWIRGAVGADKRELFEEAHLFVFPTFYPVEAQPLVLLEAMASGCAIITARAGEIPWMLDEDCAVILEEVTPEAIAEAMDTLSSNPELRVRLAQNARTRFLERFSKEVHRQNWQAILREVGAFSP